MTEHDFLPKVDALRTTLAGLLLQPAKETLRRAIHDGWRVILQPRAGAMTARLDDLVLATWWSFGADDKADWLDPVRGWDNQGRDLATLFTEIGGCLQQYLRIRLRWQAQTKFGFFKGPNAPFGTAAEIVKEQAKQEKEAAEARKKLDAMYSQALEDVMKDWRARQTALLALMGSLRDLTVELQLAEEERLRSDLAAGKNKPGTKPATIGGQLDEMKFARIDLAHFSFVPTSDFGSLLDKWRGVQKRAAAQFA